MKVKLDNVRQVVISGDYIKLDSLLKLIGIASTGGEAKILITSGDVHVCGQKCLQRGRKLRGGDVVRYGDEIIKLTDNAHADTKAGSE